MMQIKELILYGKNGKVRSLPFSIGALSIITGRSKSGKSAIGDIIDYCLGGESCNIADGVVREKVAWYGLLLQFDKDRVFVARKNPEFWKATSFLCYIEVGEDLQSPKKCDFTENSNVEGIEFILSSRLGISENLNNPPEGASRQPLSANIRHGLFYCFQGQDEIAAKNYLFHRQSEDYVTQAIKDTLPYFLGAVDEESLILENKRSLLKRKIAIEKRKTEENKWLAGGGLSRAVQLIGEAYQVGLINHKMDIDYNKYEEVYSLLQNVLSWTPSTIVDIESSRLSNLQSRRTKCLEELNEIEYKLEEAKALSGDISGFSNEAQCQKVRLESIGLFESLDFSREHCPFCSAKIDANLPSIEEMKKSIYNLSCAIDNVDKEQLKITSYIKDLEKQRQDKKELINNIELEINGLFLQQERAKNLRDINAQRAQVVGRISLWVDSVAKDIDIEEQLRLVKKYEKELADINERLSVESIDERKQFALSRIQEDMTEWARELELEHSNNPYRLDLNKATVVVDKSERSVPLKQLGSGSNWVGVHLISILALHKFFIEKSRPVPNFIFIDQPSQVYFPSETEEKRTDWEEVKRIYNFINERVKEMNGKLQIIIVDHADLENETFKKNTIESWHASDKSLIPQDWLTD